MIKLLTDREHRPHRREVFSCRAGKFALLLNRPSYAQRLDDEAYSILFHVKGDPQAYTQQLLARMVACVIGWEGVQADGQAVPFSHHGLQALLGQNLDIVPELSRVLVELFTDDSAVGEPAPAAAVFGATETAPAES